MLAKPFHKAKAILEIIESYQHQAYFVGGCVRDYLINRPIGDIDIATSATPDELQQIFESIIPVGIEHGTVIVRFEGESYEVTTFRVDGNYSDQRHPDTVTYIDQIDKDLERRDFTINALAMDKDGKIIDLFHGKSDLKEGIIRTVGNGIERFSEDPLRIIRALRFSSQLGFDIHPDTITHMKQVKQEIDGLAVERITKEFTKLFAGEHVQKALDYIINLKIYQYLPIFRDNDQLFIRLPANVKPLLSFSEVLVLFHFLDRSISIAAWAKAWKCSNKQKREALQLTEQIDLFSHEGLSPWLVYQLPHTLYDGFVRLINCLCFGKKVMMKQIMEIDHALPIHTKQEINFSGNDILELFPDWKRGSWIQQLLNSIERQIVTKQLPNEYQAIKEWIKWNPPGIN